MHQFPRPFFSVKQLLLGFSALVLAGCLSIADPPKGLSILTVISGNNQTVPINTTAPDALTIRAFDETATPMAGVAVTWSITNGAGTLSTTSTTTDGSGTTSVTYKAGATAGTANIKASAKDLSVTFTEVAQ